MEDSTMNKIIPKIIMIATLLLAIGTCGYKVRTSSHTSDESSPAHSLKLYAAYNLLMRPADGREFDHGASKGRLYRLIEDEGTIVLSCNESGFLGGTAFTGRIEFDPHTRRGTWTANDKGIPHGGNIELSATTVGFDFKITTTAGPNAGRPPAYGQLTIQP